MAPKKILLAEDDVDDQFLFNDFLGYRTDIVLMPVAENGVALVDSLESITEADDLPDLIILDQNMPKRNGLQTLQLLKETHRYTHIPVMIYSTYADQQLINEGSKMGASAVMPKPLTKEGYDKMIDAFLKVLL
jgi:CheY-like chemotaxis protein